MAEPYKIPWYISQDAKDGDPPISWENSQRPKLRKFNGDIVLGEYIIGRGMDGIVIEAWNKHRNHRLAIKVFYSNNQPPPIGAKPAFTMSNPMDPQNPLRSKQCQVQHYKGAPRYWAFERKCINMALLEKIDASLRLARESGRIILLNPKPTTSQETFQNLRSFSAEACDKKSEAGTTIIAHTQEPKAFHDDKQYFAIVYDFVPEGQLEAKNIIDQLNFFHIVGFLNVQLKLENWLSTGVLVDFSDIVPIHTGWNWWRESSMNVGTKAQEQQV
ncbi:kinase-like domain [Fusarium agapanthi]|uniref:Kinase-like domain n=1 Tax=Fusarium agapanthi TaxID=1803897 RepID=A0A9P5BGX3_9HYPO|nr:kinase-like domain [Fusarium agapanthi]